MILLWLAAGLLSRAGDGPPPDPVGPTPITPTYVGGAANAMRLGQRVLIPRAEASQPESKSAPVNAETTLDIAKMVEYHAEQRARQLPIPLPQTAIAAAIGPALLPDPAIELAMLQLQMDWERNEAARMLIIAQESEMLDAANAAFAWFMQET